MAITPTSANRLGQVVSAIIADSGGVGKCLLVKNHTTAGQVTLCGAGGRPRGVTLEAQSTQYGPVELAEGPCVVAIVAAGIIARLTGGKPTQVKAAANGRVAAVSTSGGGTEEAIGEMYGDSAAAGAAGDIVYIRLYGAAIEITIPAGS